MGSDPLCPWTEATGGWGGGGTATMVPRLSGPTAGKGDTDWISLVPPEAFTQGCCVLIMNNQSFPSIYLFLFLLLFLFAEVNKWILFLLLGLFSNSILGTLIVSVRKKEKVTKSFRKKKEESCLLRTTQTIMISPSSSSSSFWSSSLCKASDFSFYHRKKESLFS